MIKDILDEIAQESSTNKKMEILRKYADNQLLQRVLYLALSKRIKFYMRQIPEYTNLGTNKYTLNEAIEEMKYVLQRKVTGHDAQLHVKNLLQGMSANDAYVLERIIEKDLKIGMGRSNVNKVIPNLIEKTPYQGAKSFSEKLAKDIFDKYGYAYSDVKMDGRYANCIINDGVEFESRQGETTYIPQDSLLVKELSKFPDGVLNGELTMVEEKEINVKVGERINVDGIEYTPKELYEKFKIH
jgi:hypothetical protein